MQLEEFRSWKTGKENVKIEVTFQLFFKNVFLITL